MLAAGAALRIALAFSTFGLEFDINSLATVGAELTGPDPLGVYGAVNGGISGIKGAQLMQWPYPSGFFGPIGAAIFIDHRTPLPFHGLIQLPAIFADLGIALLVQLYLGWRGAGMRFRLASAAAVVFGPIFASISGYHGQIDSFAFLPAVVALIVWEGRGRELIAALPNALERRFASIAAGGFMARWGSRALIAGLLLGLGASVKTVPALMVIALLPSARSLREAATLVCATAAVPLAGLIPFLIADPSGVVEIGSYRGAPGVGGLGLAVQPDLAEKWLLRDGLDFNGISAFLYDNGQLLLTGALVSVGILMRRSRPEPVDAAVLLWITFFALSPNFFFQYLIWGMPFMLMAGYLRSVVLVQVLLIAPAILHWMGPWRDSGIAVPYVVLMISVWLAWVVAFAVLLRTELTAQGGERSHRVAVSGRMEPAAAG